jgi:hypothetical protein
MKKYFFAGLITLVAAVGVGITLGHFWKQNREQEAGNKEKDGFDKPEGFYQYFKEITTPIGKHSSGYQPNNSLHELYKAKEEQKSKKKSSTPSAVWTQRGPVNIGGRTRCILVDPDDPSTNTWFTGTAGGGIWKTSDAGLNWTDIAPDLPNLSTTTLCMAPSNHNVILAGTGEGYGGEGMIAGNGIFVSHDRGKTWAIIASTDGNQDFRYVNKIWIDPANENIIIAVTNTGIFKSTDDGLIWNTKLKTLNRVQDIVQNPLNPDVLYAALNSYGIVKSTDKGETWFKSSQGLGRGYRMALAVSPVDTAYVFACVENQSQEMDVYISVNSGLAWRRQKDLTGTFFNFHKAQGWYNSLIEPHPFKKNVVYVGGVYIGKVEFGVMASESTPQVIGVDTLGTNDFIDFINFGGGFLAGGMSTGLDESASVVLADFTSVELRFGPGKKQKAHRFEVPVGRGSGVLPAEYIYMDYVDVPFEAWDVKNNKQLAISFRDQERDGTFNLIARNPDDDLLGREYIFIQAIDYDPINPSPLVTKAGGHYEKMLYFFWPTIAAGKTWAPDALPDSKIFIDFGKFKLQAVSTTILQDDTKNTNLHVDHHDMVIIPGADALAPLKIIDANDGGVAISLNSGTTWTQLLNGYITTQFYGVAKRPGAEEYIGGMQDNGTWQSPTGVIATNKVIYVHRIDGDGFQTIWHSTLPNKIIGSVYNNNFYSSINYGVSWRSSSLGINADGPFISKLSNSTANPDVLFAVGAKGVYKHTRFGDPAYAWSKIALTTGWTIDNTAYSSMNIKVSLADPNIVWAGTGMYAEPKLNIFLSKNQGVKFDTVGNYDIAEMGLLSGMATHPANPAEAFLLFSYKSSPKIIRTYNYGASWQDISGFGKDSISSNGFPDVMVHDLLVLPNDTSIIWVGTEIGIFESTDNGISWHILDSNLPAVSVFQLFQQDGQIVAATHGRGIWTTHHWVVGVKNNTVYSKQELKVYPNPAKDFISYDFTSRRNTQADVRIISLSGQVVLTQKHDIIAGDKTIQRLEIHSLTPGTYFLEVTSDGISQTAKFVKQQ